MQVESKNKRKEQSTTEKKEKKSMVKIKKRSPDLNG